MKTMRRQLLIYLCVGMMTATVLAGIATYIEVRNDTSDLFDYQLKQIAAALPNEMTAENGIAAENEVDEETAVQIWDRRGVLIFTSGPFKTVPYSRKSGFSSISIDGVGWRLYTEDDHGRITQIAQPNAIRNKLAAAMAMRALSPFVALIPILAFLIWSVVGRSLQPLQELAWEVKSRSPTLLTPLETHRYPPELSPILTALNDLLARLNDALDAQRAFVADAAHELRTPLAALKFQLHLVEKERNPRVIAQGFGKLHDRLNRATHMVHQLLVLARHEQPYVSGTMKMLDPAQLIADTVSDHALQAEIKGIDLGVVSDETVDAALQILGDEDSLRILLGNLIDNAVRYTARGGRVDVTFETRADVGILAVSDNGPGIPACDRSRVFDRFYRREGTDETGSGLGLFIARAIASQHQAQIDLNEGPLGGLIVRVHIPLVHRLSLLQAAA
ncbi:ATP-binding protein [uncultured Oxalicibacterium sp.]|uniref:ATP-binding protein n=1 Tax=uncultured Oxalicibacterium sp. TaxID=1168540 RepID=UPI0025DA6EE0|nr:ATP-binding protein [uncultured Oxalicibacterium sp.]